LFENKRERAPIAKIFYLSNVNKVINVYKSKMKIKKDESWKRDIIDVIGSPQRVQYHFNNELEPAHSFDCDDYACWCANVIEEHHNPAILSVSWLNEETGKVDGHSVCVTLRPSKWKILKEDQEPKEYSMIYHIGNWGMFGPYGNVIQVLESIRAGITTAEGRRTLVGWTLLSKDLKVLDFGTGNEDFPEYFF
jgi:hypothetical protein